MDFFLGIIIGITFYVVGTDIKKRIEESKKPKRGRPPTKKLKLPDFNESDKK